jgi:hypothetical protein
VVGRATERDIVGDLKNDKYRYYILLNKINKTWRNTERTKQFLYDDFFLLFDPSLRFGWDFLAQRSYLCPLAENANGVLSGCGVISCYTSEEKEN